jgi:hypothetical protein
MIYSSVLLCFVDILRQGCVRRGGGLALFYAAQRNKKSRNEMEPATARLLQRQGAQTYFFLKLRHFSHSKALSFSLYKYKNNFNFVK